MNAVFRQFTPLPASGFGGEYRAHRLAMLQRRQMFQNRLLMEQGPGAGEMMDESSVLSRSDAPEQTITPELHPLGFILGGEKEILDIEIAPINSDSLREITHRGQIFKHVHLMMNMVWVKWPRRNHICVHDHINVALRINWKANQIVDAFQKSFHTCGWILTVNPIVKLPVPIECRERVVGNWVLAEKYVMGLDKINSNTGEALKTKSTPAKLIQALSHFSYVWSHHQLVLCNIWAAFDLEDKIIRITSPTIHTREGDIYGCADLGVYGMRNFFHNHECNRFCKGYTTPSQKPYFTPTLATLLSNELDL